MTPSRRKTSNAPEDALPEYALGTLSRYRTLLGDEWESFLEHLARPLPTSVWRNFLRIDGAEFDDWVRAVESDVTAEPVRWCGWAYRLWRSDEPSVPDRKPGNRIGYAAGLYHVQEEVSLLPPTALDPAPGERVLDLCAAPGNKTALLSALMENRGLLVANDKDTRRIRSGGPTWDRLGLTNIVATCYDGLKFPHVSGGFTGILVDAPCSGQGTFRKSPGSLRASSPGFAQHLRETQRGLLRRAAQLCAAGGRIVYSTCTYAPEENEGMVAEFLRRHPGFAVADITLSGFRHSRGLTEWNGESFHPDIARCWRIWPHQNDTGGFFLARLERKE